MHTHTVNRSQIKSTVHLMPGSAINHEGRPEKCYLLGTWHSLLDLEGGGFCAEDANRVT